MLNGSERIAAFRKIDSVLRAALMAEVDDCPEAYGISPTMWDDMVDGRTAAVDVFAPAFAAAAAAATEESRARFEAAGGWSGLRESCRALAGARERVAQLRKETGVK